MYGMKREIEEPFRRVVEKIKEALKKEGFGILTEIDVKATMKKKLDKEVEDYLILGACNPPFAYRALQAEQDIGLLLPCNVIIYRKNNCTHVSVIKPTLAMHIVQNEELNQISGEIELKLKNALDSITKS